MIDRVRAACRAAVHAHCERVQSGSSLPRDSLSRLPFAVFLAEDGGDGFSLYQPDDGLDLLCGRFAALLNFHCGGNLKAERAGEIGKAVVERHKLPAGKGLQRLFAIGLCSLILRRDGGQVLLDQGLFVRIEFRKPGGDIFAH